MYLVRVCLLFSALTLLTSCHGENSTPMRVGTNVWPGYEPLYVARARGELDGAKVSLFEYQSASEVIRAFRNGSIDAASLTLDEVMQLRAAGMAFRIVLVHDVSVGADVILARQGFSSMQDLRGKRIGVESGAEGTYMITRALELNGMGIRDVVVVNMEVHMHENAFNRERVDAVVTFEPVRSKLLAKGANEIFSSKEIPGEIVDVLIVNEDYLSKHQSNVKSLIDSWFEALEFKKSDIREYIRISAERLKLEEDKLLQSLQGMQFPNHKENAAMLAGEHPALEKDLAKIRRIFELHGLIPMGIDINGLVTYID